MNGMFN
jgi:hypothetical protein